MFFEKSDDDDHSSFIMICLMHFILSEVCQMCDVSVQDCKPSRSPLFVFSQRCKFFGFAKNRSCSISRTQKKLPKFVSSPAMLRPLVLVLVLWPAIGEVTCSEETTLVQRRHRTGNFSPKVHAVFEL